MKKKEWANNSWVVGIGCAVVSLLLTMGYDYSKQNPILTTVAKILKLGWFGLLGILNFEIRLWWLLCAVSLFIIIVRIFDSFRKAPEHPSNRPDFYDYTEDQFRKWKWSWDWKYSLAKKAWVAENMQAHCPQCDTPLIFTHGFAEVKCPRCSYAEYSDIEFAYTVEHLILDNVARKRAGKPIPPVR
jgi:hypothetical protein